jgi:hypothetical protein
MFAWFAFLIYISFILLSIVILTRGKKSLRRDIFHPSILFICLLVMELPYLVSVLMYPDELDPRYNANTNFDSLFVQFVLIKAMFSFVFLSVCELWTRGRVGQPNIPKLSGAAFSFYGLTFLFGALLLTIVLVDRVGGIDLMLRSWSTKTELVKGTAVLRLSMLVLFSLAVGSFVIQCFSSSSIVTRTSSVFLPISILAGFICLGLFGERKAPILLIVIYMVGKKLLRPHEPLFSPFIIIVGLFVVGFSALAPVLRRPDGVEMFVSGDAQTFALEVSKNFGQLFIRFSDLPISLYVYNHVTSIGDLWFLKTVPDLFYGFIPSSFFPDKPPLDEGVYIYNIAQGNKVEFGSAFSEMIPVGWPLSRINGPFLHLWYFGVMLGAVFSGWFTTLIYKYLINNFNPAYLFLYVITSFTGFGLTNSFVFSTICYLILLIPVFFVFRRKRRLH